MQGALSPPDPNPDVLWVDAPGPCGPGVEAGGDHMQDMHLNLCTVSMIP